jgi:hypothetical protein
VILKDSFGKDSAYTILNPPSPSSVCQRCWNSRCQECKGSTNTGCGSKLIDKLSRRDKIEKISN